MERDLRDYARVLYKRRWLIAVILLVSVGVAGFFTARALPVYQATGSLFVGPKQVPRTQLGESIAIGQLSAELVESYAIIVASRSIAEKAVEEFRLPVAPGQIAGGLIAFAVPDTQVIRLAYRSTNPAVAQRVLNAVEEVFVREIGKIDAAVDSNDAAAVTVSIIDRALEPTAPIAPNPVQNMTLSVIVGVLAGIALAFVLDVIDNTVKNREEIESLTGLPVLASVPTLETYGSEVFLERDPQASGSEAFRMLRTAVQFRGVDRRVQVIMVTSPVAREGKTTVALNLAASWAQAGFKTVLVEADLRRPSLHHLFRSDGKRGLTTTLVGWVKLDGAVLSTGLRNLHCLLAGAIPPNPTELLVSDRMGQLLKELRSKFEMIVLDMPPMLPVADASALVPQVDGVIVVTRVRKTRRDRLRDAMKLLDKSKDLVLGVVLNGLKKGDLGYDYDYRYDAYPPDAPPGESAAWERNERDRLQPVPPGEKKPARRGRERTPT